MKKKKPTRGAVFIPEKIKTLKQNLQQETKKNPAISLLGIDPKQPQTLHQNDIYIIMFSATFFITQI